MIDPDETLARDLAAHEEAIGFQRIATVAPMWTLWTRKVETTGLPWLVWRCFFHDRELRVEERVEKRDGGYWHVVRIARPVELRDAPQSVSLGEMAYVKRAMVGETREAVTVWPRECDAHRWGDPFARWLFALVRIEGEARPGVRRALPDLAPERT